MEKTGTVSWKVYLVTCSDGSLYCGIAKDVTARIARHNAGKGAKYTKTRLPVKLAAVSGCLSKGDALRLEYRIKQQPACRKTAALKRMSAQ